MARNTVIATAACAATAGAFAAPATGGSAAPPGHSSPVGDRQGTQQYAAGGVGADLVDLSSAAPAGA